MVNTWGSILWQCMVTFSSWSNQLQGPTIVEATIEDYSPQQIQVQKSVTESMPFSLLDGEKVIETEDAVVLELCSVDSKRVDRKHTEGVENKGSIFITSFQIVFVPYVWDPYANYFYYNNKQTCRKRSRPQDRRSTIFPLV